MHLQPTIQRAFNAALLLASISGIAEGQVVGVSGTSSCSDGGSYVLLAGGELYRAEHFGTWSLVGNALGAACTPGGSAVGLTTTTALCDELYATNTGGDLLVGSSRGMIWSCRLNVFAATGRPQSEVAAIGTNAYGGILVTTITGDVFMIYANNGFGVEYRGNFYGSPTSSTRVTWGAVKREYASDK